MGCFYMDKAGVYLALSKASELELELVWIPKIMANQTDDEVDRGETNKNNKLGLNKADSVKITRYYHKISNGEHLSWFEAERVREILPKYWQQYVRMTEQDKRIRQRAVELKEAIEDETQLEEI